MEKLRIMICRRMETFHNKYLKVEKNKDLMIGHHNKKLLKRKIIQWLTFIIIFHLILLLRSYLPEYVSFDNYWGLIFMFVSVTIIRKILKSFFNKSFVKLFPNIYSNNIVLSKMNSIEKKHEADRLYYEFLEYQKIFELKKKNLRLLLEDEIKENKIKEENKIKNEIKEKTKS